MKRFIYLAAAILGISGLSYAGPCAAGSLATYISLGATGCMIGADTLFDFSTVSGTFGATEISTSSVSLSPSGGSYNPELTASITESAGPNMLFETIFTYQIKGIAFTSSTISLSGSSETGDGGVTDIQNYCAGGTFGPDGVSGCTANAGSLLTLDTIQNQDSGSFAPAMPISVTDDFTLDGGTVGSASGGKITDQFSVPEPMSFVLTGVGLALAIGLKRRISGASVFEIKGNL